VRGTAAVLAVKARGRGVARARRVPARVNCRRSPAAAAGPGGCALAALGVYVARDRRVVMVLDLE
jgi:hypothetical protein